MIWAKRKARLAILLGIGAFLIGAGYFYVHFYLARPTGDGPAGPSVALEPFAMRWSDRDVLLLGIGDSITAGLGADTPDHTFFNRLHQNPPDEFGDMRGRSLSTVLPNLRQGNFAISGSTSCDHATVIEERLEVQTADVFGLVVMTTGGNDLIHPYGRRPPRECAMYGATLAQADPWIEAFGVRLDGMIQNITGKFPGGCEIYLADIYDPTDGVGDAPSIFLPPWPDGLAIHSRYNGHISRVCAAFDHVHLVGLHAEFLGHGSHSQQFWRSTYQPDDPTYWFYTNIEDPNDRGYDAIRRLFLNEIVDHSVLRSGNPTRQRGPTGNPTR